MANFDLAFKYTASNEGFFSNHSKDRGGATMVGITQVTLSRWRKRPVSIAEVKDLSIEEAKNIYKAWYWDVNALDYVDVQGMATCIYDIGVVRGVRRGAQYAQRVCNTLGSQLYVDGHVGSKTLKALNATNSEAFIRSFSAMAAQGFRNIVTKNPSQRVFAKGWNNRAKRLLELLK